MAKIIAPSLLSADFLRLGEVMDMLNHSEASWIHLDIMDGRFVPNISFGFPVIEKIRSATGKALDVHLMIVEPEKYIERFRQAGADCISVHYEGNYHLHRTLNTIRELGCKAGVVLNPQTPVTVLEELLTSVDFVLLMSVNPGFGGQRFIPGTLRKIRTLRELIMRNSAQVLIEVDGGVDLANAGQLCEAGADILVAGNSIFSAADPVAVIRSLAAYH